MGPSGAASATLSPQGSARRVPLPRAEALRLSSGRCRHKDQAVSTPTAAAGAAGLVLWEEGPWGQWGCPTVPVSPKVAEANPQTVMVRGSPGARPGCAQPSTGPALVTPKARGRPLQGKPDARPLLPSTPTQTSPAIPSCSGSSSSHPGAPRRPRGPGPVPKRPENQGSRSQGLRPQQPKLPPPPPHPGLPVTWGPGPESWPRCAGPGPRQQRRAWDSPHAS